MSSNQLEHGWVIRLQSGFYTVQIATGIVVCGIRGKLKKVDYGGDFIALGDRVMIQRLDDGHGIIESIDERHNALVRLDPTPRGEYRQIMLANIDQIVLVFACAQPEPHLGMVDRFLVISEKEKIPALIVANKIDLVKESKPKLIFGLYEKLGYPVLYSSAKEKIGIQKLRNRLKGKISGFAGPSGAGKSSLLNAIQPGLGLIVGKVKEVTSKGKHTTNVREMFSLNNGGFVADLPGLRSLALWDTQPEELDGYFPEIRDLVQACQFNDCTHRNEPGCAVRLALKNGNLDPRRYESYLKIRFG
jgi:ribosome biogenesis GTPase / thiamine phosphate phosphatase